MCMRLVCMLVILSCQRFTAALTFQTRSVELQHQRSSSSFRVLQSSLSSSLAMSTQSTQDRAGSPLKILGVCGGIGSGKSTACKLLVSELNCAAHIDADAIAHTVYRPGSQAVKDVAEAFGSDIMQSNGEIDRKKLGSIVFADIKDMQKLERIVWPHVKQDILDQIKTIEKEWTGHGEPIIVVEAAVLLDAGWQDFLSGILVVTASHRVALDRLMENRDLSEEEAEKRMGAQSSRRGIGNLKEEVKNKVVTSVVQNDGSLDDLTKALAEMLSDEATWYTVQ